IKDETARPVRCIVLAPSGVPWQVCWPSMTEPRHSFDARVAATPGRCRQMASRLGVTRCDIFVSLPESQLAQLIRSLSSVPALHPPNGRDLLGRLLRRVDRRGVEAGVPGQLAAALDRGAVDEPAGHAS